MRGARAGAGTRF